MAEWATRSRRDRNETDRHADLLRSARTVFERDGIEGASVAAVTQGAGISRATFYVYFASLDEALAAIAEQVRDDLIASQQVPADLDDPVSVARWSVGAFLDARVRNLQMLDVIESRAHRDPEMRRLWDELTEHPLRRTARFARRIEESGVGTPAAAPHAVARAAYGMVVAYASWVAGHPERRDDAVTDLSRMFLSLLGLPPGTGAD